MFGGFRRSVSQARDCFQWCPLSLLPRDCRYAVLLLLLLRRLSFCFSVLQIKFRRGSYHISQ